MLRNECLGPTLTTVEFVIRVREIIDHLDPTEPDAIVLAADCAVDCAAMQQPLLALEIVERFALTDDSVGRAGIPFGVWAGQIALTLGDRDGFDRRLDAALEHTHFRRASWLYEGHLHQAVAMRELFSGNWVAAEEAVAVVERVGGHDLNFVLGCSGQRSTIASETGRVQERYEQAAFSASTFPDFPLLRAILVFAAAEAGHHDEAAALLDELAPNDFAAVGRGWLTTAVLTAVASAIVSVEAHPHAAVLRRLLTEYTGLMARVASGTDVLCAYDRLLAGLAAGDGDHAEADRLFAAAVAQEEALRAPPLVTRTKHWWGRALVRRGDPTRARPLLTDARASAAHLGMLAVVTQIDDLLATIAS